MNQTKHIICFSGGHSSALVAIEVVRKYGKENIVLINHECKLEDPDVSRFENEVADYLGLPITYVSMADAQTKDQFDVVTEKGSFINPSDRQALCTFVMKTEPFMNFLFSQYSQSDNLFEPAKPCLVYYGFDKEEKVRIQRRSTIMAVHGYKTAFPIAHWKRTITSTLEIGIWPPRVYLIFKHANCIGCLKAGWQHWYCVYVFYPEIFEKAKLTEEKIGHSIHKDAFLYEKETMFEQMVKAGIEPTEKIQSQTFWAMVKKILGSCDIDLNEEAKPCECSEPFLVNQ